MARQTTPLPENKKKKQLPSGRETGLQHLINNWTFKRELAFHCFLLLKKNCKVNGLTNTIIYIQQGQGILSQYLHNMILWNTYSKANLEKVKQLTFLECKVRFGETPVSKNQYDLEVETVKVH